MIRHPRIAALLQRLLGKLRGRLRLLTFALLGAALLAPTVGPSQTPLTPPVPAPASQLDVPLRLITEAQQAYANVHDYTCTFIKREQVRGQLQPEHVLQMKVRAQPFSVYLRWQAPKPLEGQEACYVVGRNNGQMRVHSTGFLGVVGWVSLDTNDPRAMENSRHTIPEAGIGNLIEKYIQRYEAEKQLNRTLVRVGEFEFAKRRCYRIETIHPNSKPGDYYAFRCVLYLDKETKLPIRSEAYDWPRQGGPPDGALLECFSYVGMKLNVGLGDADFNY